MYLRQSFERTCGTTKQLLVQMIDNISAQLGTSKCPTPQATSANIGEDKQFLVSALTGKFALCYRQR